MWKILIIVAVPIVTPLCVYLLSTMKRTNKYFSEEAAKLNTAKCPYCHKIQDVNQQGTFKCPQCKTTLRYQEDLTVHIVPYKISKTEVIPIVTTIIWLLLAAIMPVYYLIDSGFKYGERNIFVFFMLFSIAMAISGLKDGVVGARFGRIYQADTPKLFYLTVSIWAVFSVACASAFVYDVLTGGRWK
jgi:hypothetical protein